MADRDSEMNENDANDGPDDGVRTVLSSEYSAATAGPCDHVAYRL